MSLSTCFSGCTVRQELPPPIRPFTLTPDAPFRSRKVVAADILIPELKIDWEKLKNDLTVVHVERPQAPNVVVAYVNRQAGTLSSEYAGELVRLTATSLVKAGTPWHGTVLGDLRVNGAPIWVNTNGDATSLELDVLASALDQATAVLARTVREPAFMPGGFEQARVASLGRIRDATYLTGNLAFEQMLNGMLGEEVSAHFLGVGSTRMAAVTVEQVRRCYADLYRPESSAVLVVGPVSLAESVEVVKRYFGSWSPTVPARAHHRQAVTVRAPAAGVRIQLVDQPGATQADILLAQRAPATMSDDMIPLQLASVVLGGTFDSRMNHLLRHEEGSTYGVGAHLSAFRDFGVQLTRGHVDAWDAGHAIRELLAEIRRLQREPLSPDELALAKVRLGVAFRQQASDVEAISRLLAEMFTYAAPDLLLRREQALRSATTRQIQEAAQRYFHPASVDIIVFGDARELFSELQSTGSVDLFRVRDAPETNTRNP